MVARVLPIILLAATCATACAGPSAESTPEAAAPPPEAIASPEAAAQLFRLLRATPILAVDAIEPVLPFWEALGFKGINPTRQGGRLVFMAFAKDGLEIHYQTRAHIQATMPAAKDRLANATALVYLTVDNLDAVVLDLDKAAVLIPRRRTEWGSDEIYVREPGGNIIAFAAFGG